MRLLQTYKKPTVNDDVCIGGFLHTHLSVLTPRKTRLLGALRETESRKAERNDMEARLVRSLCHQQWEDLADLEEVTWP